MVWIDYFNFENEEWIHSTGAIRAMHSIIAQLYIYIVWTYEIILLFIKKTVLIKISSIQKFNKPLTQTISSKRFYALIS
jgi:hypothetical protein